MSVPILWNSEIAHYHDQGHMVKEDVRLGNLWSTVFERMNVPIPKNFQGGEADGVIKELV